MTKAEAIAMLKRIQEPEAWEPQINQAAFEAFDMAIKALEQQPCEDTISRRAAIDFIDAGHLVNPNEPRWSDNEVVNFLKSRPSAQPEQRWIPCSERLPERGKDVLVTRDYDGREDCNKSFRYVEIASRYGEDDDPDWTSFSDEYKMHPKNHHVIAWRELPEPYREERTEE